MSDQATFNQEDRKHLIENGVLLRELTKDITEMRTAQAQEVRTLRDYIDASIKAINENLDKKLGKDEFKPFRLVIIFFIGTLIAGALATIMASAGFKV